MSIPYAVLHNQGLSKTKYPAEITAYVSTADARDLKWRFCMHSSSM